MSGDLFLDPINMTLTPHEVELVTRAINGSGHRHGLLRAIVSQLESTGELALEEETLHTVYRYAYTDGGDARLLDRFRAVTAAATRAGWEPR